MGGLECLKMIESQANAKFSASTDETGNLAQHGNWELERGGRDVSKIYFHEHMLEDFTKVMCPGPKTHAGDFSHTAGMSNPHTTTGAQDTMSAGEHMFRTMDKHESRIAPGKDGNIPLSYEELAKKPNKHKDAQLTASQLAAV